MVVTIPVAILEQPALIGFVRRRIPRPFIGKAFPKLVVGDISLFATVILITAITAGIF